MGVVQTFYCGNLKFEAEVISHPMGTSCVVSVRMYVTDSIYIQRYVSRQTTPDDNPESRAFMTLLINDFIEGIEGEASRDERGDGLSAFLKPEAVLSTLNSRLCYDVDHEFEPSHPKWLISDRSV